MRSFLILFLSLNFFGQYSFGQMLEGDLLNALEEGGWGEEYKTKSAPQDAPKAKDPQEAGNKTSQDLDCNSEEERNTVPYKFLLGLLANQTLDISHDPHSGTLNFNGGIMIGNCQSMLQTVVSKPNENIPYYTFQVAVKRPGGCKDSECSYDVTEIRDGDNKKLSKNFKPNFAGFVDCLKATGVFEGGKIRQSKVAPVEFNHVERDINLTSEVVYANRGFKGTRYAGKFSENKIPDYPGCYYFEDVKRGGFKTYSVDDMENFELEQLYQKVCKSGNYKVVDRHISDFNQIIPLQNGLIDIRNRLILDEVKRLHEIVSEAEDLSEADKSKFKEVTSDFLEHVVKPMKNDLAQLQRLYANPGHSQKEKILNSVFGPEKAKKFMGMGPSDLKDAVKEEMDERASKLVDYAREPYLTKDDYVKMASGKHGAPIDNSTWSSAVLDLYEVHNTAFNYGRYSDDFWESHYKDNPRLKNEKRYESGAKLNRKIASKMRKKRGSLKRVSEVASNPGVDYGAKYRRSKETVVADIDREIASYRANMQEALVKVRTGCAQEKAQKYWISQQACVRDAREQLEACQREIDALMQSRRDAIRKYDAMIAEWEEAQGQARGDDSSDSSRTSSSGGDGETFTFAPTETAQPTMNDQYSRRLAQMRMRMLRMRQRQYRGSMPMAAQGSNFWRGGGGLSARFNTGFNSQYSYRNRFGGNYNGWNRMPAGGYQSQHPAVSYFNQTATRPGGNFSFAGSGGQGGQMWAGGTPGFYAPGGPGFR